MKEAYLYEKLDSGKVRCFLCRQGCVIKEGKTGQCGVRRNFGGVLRTLVYDRIVAANVDAIEKKPLYHFAPGAKAFSIGTVGCNFRCSFCQNYSISQSPREAGNIIGERTTPQQVVRMALEHDCRTIAYTYTEPTIFYELARDTMVEAKNANLLNVFVTNGYMTREMLDDAADLLDGANVDLKAFNPEFYKKNVKADLEGVKDSLVYLKEKNIWTEVTTLLIPTLNDDMDELRALARFISDDLGPETPWHISRFFPQYKETELPPTDPETLRRARSIGLDAGLHYVYLGNLRSGEGESTVCPSCSSVLIERSGYTLKNYSIKGGRCSECGREIEGVEL